MTVPPFACTRYEAVILKLVGFPNTRTTGASGCFVCAGVDIPAFLASPNWNELTLLASKCRRHSTTSRTDMMPSRVSPMHLISPNFVSPASQFLASASETPVHPSQTNLRPALSPSNSLASLPSPSPLCPILPGLPVLLGSAVLTNCDLVLASEGYHDGGQCCWVRWSHCGSALPGSPSGGIRHTLWHRVFSPTPP